MYKIALVLIAGILVSGCNSSEEPKTGNRIERTEADSMFDVVNAGHIIGMGKMDDLDAAKQKAKTLIDSIAKLPAKAKEASAPYVARLNDVVSDITSSEGKMQKWMKEFDLKKATEESKERLEYLKNEKIKVDDMKESILSSLSKADSVLRARF